MEIEPQAFKKSMTGWATGVTIVATRHKNLPVGMTISSFASVSLQPPQILIGVNDKAHTHAAIEESGYFSVNILGVEHLAWGMRFAGLQPTITDRFQGIAWFTAQTGAPILPDVLGWLDCQLCHTFASGDHTVFVSEVAACGGRADGPPLLYYRRNWRQLVEQVLQLEG